MLIGCWTKETGISIMARPRVRQFSEDMGIEYSEAKSLIEEGRKRNDKGKQIMKKYAKGGSAGSRGKMSEKARRLSDTKRNMLRKEKAAKESRMKMMMEESEKPLSKGQMEYIEDGGRGRAFAYKDGGAVCRGMGKAYKGKPRNVKVR